jgi:DNA-binding NtrC family response regulator
VKGKKCKVKTNQRAESEIPITLSEHEKAYILKLYHQTDKNKTQTAKLLAVGINTLRRKLLNYSVD